MKGQITIVVFMAALLDLIVLAVLAPVFNAAVDILIAALGTDTVSIFLARMLMPVLVFGIIFSALYYISPNRNIRF
jgi:uncharacterized BrkB/YihY/UPF0761 family membrane protein